MVDDVLGLFLSKRRVERHSAGLEVEPLDELGRLAGPCLAVHPDVFPFDREGTVVTHAHSVPE